MHIVDVAGVNLYAVSEVDAGDAAENELIYDATEEDVLVLAPARDDLDPEALAIVADLDEVALAQLAQLRLRWNFESVRIRFRLGPRVD